MSLQQRLAELGTEVTPAEANELEKVIESAADSIKSYSEEEFKYLLGRMKPELRPVIQIMRDL